MNETKQVREQDAINFHQLARAVRFALVAIVPGLSYLSLRSSLSIGSFRQIFADMLAGRPLPALTQFVLSAQPFLVAISVLIPVIAIATLFMRAVVSSFYIIGALGFVTIAEFITLYYGLSAPLTQIISNLGGAPRIYFQHTQRRTKSAEHCPKRHGRIGVFSSGRWLHEPCVD